MLRVHEPNKEWRQKEKVTQFACPNPACPYYSKWPDTAQHVALLDSRCAHS
ncbi:MAG TPA: hypothetical protein VKK81_19990 [Candidatus Binatia bacterium]|nr:hypothetical protein [Candidatus Binatia bacterium]